MLLAGVALRLFREGNVRALLMLRVMRPMDHFLPTRQPDENSAKPLPEDTVHLVVVHPEKYAVD